MKRYTSSKELNIDHVGTASDENYSRARVAIGVWLEWLDVGVKLANGISGTAGTANDRQSISSKYSRLLSVDGTQTP